MNFLRVEVLEHVASKLEKMANFFKFQSISIHAIRGDRRQETVSVPSDSLKHGAIL